MPIASVRRPAPRFWFASKLAFAVVGAVVCACAALAMPGCAHHPPTFDPHARRTCLVLSAGGTRGVAELGALAAVRQAGVPVSCVVGTSVGALVGALYASRPAEDTTVRWRRLTGAYLDETEREAETRGVGAGLVAGAMATAFTSGVLAPATAALGGYLLGAATTTRADRGRLERVLSAELGGARIETLPVPFATLHHERADQGLRLVVDRTGDLAHAVGASVANPFVFEDVDVTSAPAIDPGADRVAATPVEDACRLFPDSNLLVINVSGAPAFHDARMTCPLREVMITVPAVAPEAVFQGGPAFDQAWRSGYDAMTTALGAAPAA